MWELIEDGKHRKLTDEEKAELQRLFLRVAENDLRLLRDETGEAVPPDRTSTYSIEERLIDLARPTVGTALCGVRICAAVSGRTQI